MSHVVVDYADTGFLKFAIEYLEYVHMGPRSNLWSKKMVENLVTLSLSANNICLQSLHKFKYRLHTVESTLETVYFVYTMQYVK